MEYARRLSERREAAAGWRRRDVHFSTARFVTIVAAAAIAWLAWFPPQAAADLSVSAWWLALPAMIFLALIVGHERVIQALRRCERAAAFYEKGVARLDHEWAGKGETGERFLDENHLFAADLDLFGRGSLFELLCTARTRSGEETLAAWLRAPAAPDVIRARQQAIEELRDRLDLREELSLLGADLRAGVEPEALAAWGTAPPVLDPDWRRPVALLLAASGVGAGVAWAAGMAGPRTFLAVIVVQAAFALPLRPKVLRVIGAVERAGHDLELLSQVLGRLEREKFTTPLLVRLRAELETSGMPPSKRIARLRRLIELLDARRNQLFSPLAYLMLWATQLAHGLEAWRAVSGSAIPRWLAAVGEMEALCALAGYAYENPSDPFPEILPPGDRPLLDGKGLGHPLIAADRCIRNDVALGGGHPSVIVVSGSNMSGKSTLLRTVGANAVLAQAGAPVRARSLRLTPLSVGATLRIQDSLQTGTSRFYAEITRLHKVVDLTRSSPPPLFLLDEMLNGTNSHDRRIGAEAVVRGLVERGAIGLVTTHDLALSQIAESLSPRAANVHFEDHLENGRMMFDYVMRPGIMTKSNALALMRAVGLDI